MNMGGTLEPTQAPGGIAGTGIGLTQTDDAAAPPPPPETFGEYKKKGEESNGVTAMMDMMIADLEKEMHEADVDEKNAQEEYTEFMADSKEKRARTAKLSSRSNRLRPGSRGTWRMRRPTRRRSRRLCWPPKNTWPICTVSAIGSWRTSTSGRPLVRTRWMR